MLARNTRVSPKLILILAVGFSCLPFINKAFHIDDRIYLATAEHILEEPWFPYDYPLVFEGIAAKDMASHSHLPFTSYLLALIRVVTGSQQEWVYHLAFLVFPLIAVLSFYQVARRYVQHPLAAALLFMAAPAYVVLSHTLMPDVPLLAFWLLAVNRFLKITSGDGGFWDRLVLVLAVLGASFMSLLTAGLLMLIVAHLFFRWWNGLPGHGTSFWALVIAGPVVLWIFWYTRAYLHYDRMVLATVFFYIKNERVAFDWGELGLKFLSFVLNSGSVFLFPLAIWAGFRGKYRIRVALLLFLANLVVFHLFIQGWDTVFFILFALFCSSGFLVLWEFVALLLDPRPERRLLFLWYFGILAACLLLYFNGSARYALLALPPVVLLWVRSLEERIVERYFLRNLLVAATVLTAVYAGAAAYADYRFADVYRTYAAEICDKYQAESATVWVAGEWGFRYYFEKEGAKLLRRTSEDPRPGDIIIKPYVAFPWVTLYDGDKLTLLVEQYVVEESFPVRLMDFSSHAGFFSTGWGLLPLSLSSGEPWEWFNVYKVKAEYSGPHPEPVEWW